MHMQMKAFCEETSECRHAQLLEYFGEDFAAGRCGDRCDNCLRAAGRLKHDPDWPPAPVALLPNLLMQMLFSL
jgi:superfamily II DNA helicase RecQ